MNDYKLTENTSKVYFNGSKWQSNTCGDFEIVGKTDRFRVCKKGYKEYKHYLCRFLDGTIVEAKGSEIKIGKVRNPNFPSICGVGFLGEGKWKFYVNQKATKEYRLFHNIINKCYNDQTINYEGYGAKGVTLENYLHDFQNFCEFISHLPNYEEWRKDKDKVWELDKDILCEKLDIEPKIYSTKTCQIITKKDNMDERNKRVSVTGQVYIGVDSNGVKHEFANIRQFAREHNLHDTHVGRCIKGKAKSHKGWTFKIKSEENEYYDN